MKKLLLLSLMVFMGCAASVSTEQYVGEYEKQKSLDEIEITKVDNLKIMLGAYDVEVSSKKISHFTNTKIGVEYWIALEPESSYNA